EILQRAPVPRLAEMAVLEMIHPKAVRQGRGGIVERLQRRIVIGERTRPGAEGQTDQRMPEEPGAHLHEREDARDAPRTRRDEIVWLVPKGPFENRAPFPAVKHRGRRM